MPTWEALATEPTPRTRVQKMTGAIIILMRLTKPRADRLELDREVRRNEADGAMTAPMHGE